MVKIKSPFRLEEYRTNLVNIGNESEFKETYKSLIEIKDTNTCNFWDKENTHMERLEFDQNPMAVDRARFIGRMLGKNKKKILDVGFGSGIVESIYYDLFPNSGIKLYGIDFSPKSVLRAKKRFPKGEFKKGSILKIPYKNEMFDTVICLEVMEHVVPSKTFLALSELYRVTKKHGKIIISVPLNEGLEEMVNQKQNPNHHVRVYSPEIIKAEMKLAGFTVLKEKYLYAFGKFYYLKSFLAKTILNYSPNNIIIIALKS